MDPSSAPDRVIKVLCYYCTDYICINQVLFPRCGHPLCQRCLDDVISKAPDEHLPPKCGICRVSMSKEQFRRIYPEISRSQEQEDAAHFVAGIQRMDTTTPAQSFTKGAEKLKRMTRKVELEPAEKARLLDAAEKMSNTIPEMAGTIASLEAENAKLREDLEKAQLEQQHWEESYKKERECVMRYRKYKDVNTDLEQRLRDLRKSHEDLINSALQAENRFRKDLEVLQEEKQALFEEKRRLEGSLLASQKKARALAGKKRKRLKVDQEEDDSLIVE